MTDSPAHGAIGGSQPWQSPPFTPGDEETVQSADGTTMIPSIATLAANHGKDLWLLANYLCDIGVGVGLVMFAATDSDEMLSLSDAKDAISTLLGDINVRDIVRQNPHSQTIEVVQAYVDGAISLGLLLGIIDELVEQTDEPPIIPAKLIPSEELAIALVEHFHLQMAARLNQN